VEKAKQQHFLELYEPVHNQLTKFCRAISGNVEDAEDLMNDTLLASFENFEKIRDISLFKSYVFSIASNLNKKKFRRKKFKAEFNEKDLHQIIDLGKNPEQIVEFNMIYEKILQLPQKMSEALILFYMNDLTLEEIQKIQGGSLSGVKQRIKRGREKLFSLLDTPEQIKLATMLFTL